MWLINELFAWVFGSNYESALKYLDLRGNITGEVVNAGSDYMNISGVLKLSKMLSDNVTQPIAICWLLLLFLLALTQMSISEQLSWEQLAKLLMKFAVVHFIAMNAFALCLSFLSLGGDAVRKTDDFIKKSGIEDAVRKTDDFIKKSGIEFMTDEKGSSETIKSKILGEVTIYDQAAIEYREVKDSSTIDKVGFKMFQKSEFWSLVKYCLMYLLFLSIPCAISVVLYCSIILASINRILIISFKLPTANIAFVDFFNGFNGSGMKNMKVFIALAYQGMVILIVVAVGNILGSSLLEGNSLFMSAIYISIVKLAQISVIGKSYEMSKEMFGV